MMNKKNGKGNLNLYFLWPIFISIILLVNSFLIYNFKTYAINIFILSNILIIIICIIIFVLFKINFQKVILNFSSKHTKEQLKLIKETAIPFVVCSSSGTILWANDGFLQLSEDFSVGKNIISLFNEIKKDYLYNMGDEHLKMYSSYKDKRFLLHLKSVNSNALRDMSDGLFKENEKLIYIYIEDKTEYYKLKEEVDNSKQVTGLIYIDNYDEVTENMEDSKASMLLAMLDRKLTRYISNNTGIIKKLEKDKYIFITTKKYIEEMINDRFSILEDTKEIIGGDNIPLTLSIGVGYEGKTVESNYDLARIAMDMALGRGGDQAVVKKAKEIFFFGGKAQSTQSSARVKARVKAVSFREILDTKDRIFVMGHKNCDLDSFGASIGIYVMSHFLGKKVHIVENTVTKEVQELKDKFLSNNNYPADLFINGQNALNMITKDDLLVLVDHNTDLISDEPELINYVDSLVIFDHHRLQASSINESLMSYVEPSASSACEIISEMIKFFDDSIRLKAIEAEAMLSGMMVDTLNFTYHVSSKTFDSASFLRDSGAEIDKVRKLLRTDKNVEKIKNTIVDSAEYYKDAFAIATIENYHNVDLNVLASKVANELINIKGTKASVVIYKDGEKYSLSSRSIDDINVQVLMERLGGGGHRSQAGAKVTANDFNEVVNKVKETIDQMLLEKEVE